MRKYTITYSPSDINFRPESELEEIFQNINTILGTYKFTVPLFREFGFIAEFIDKPMNTIQPLYTKEVIETIEKYEPRVIVEEVRVGAEVDGFVRPKITFGLTNEVMI